MRKKLLSVLLVLTMLCVALPATALGATSSYPFGFRTMDGRDLTYPSIVDLGSRTYGYTYKEAADKVQVKLVNEGTEQLQFGSGTYSRAGITVTELDADGNEVPFVAGFKLDPGEEKIYVVRLNEGLAVKTEAYSYSIGFMEYTHRVMSSAVFNVKINSAEAVKPDYTFKFRTMDGKELTYLNKVDLGVRPSGYTYDPAVDTVQVRLVNEGNQVLNFGSGTYSDGLIVTEGADEAAFSKSFTMQPGEEKIYNVTLKEGIAARTQPYDFSILYMEYGRRVMGSAVFTVTVNNNEISIIPKGIEKYYGETKSSADVAFTVENDAVSPEALGLVFGSAGFDSGASVGTYPYTHDEYINGYHVTNLAPEAGVTVLKAVPEAETVNATGLHGTDDELHESTLTGRFKNPYTGEYVPGTLAWNEPDKAMTKTGFEGFTFTPDDLVNYKVYTGEAEVIVSEKYPTDLQVSFAADLNPVYDGYAHGVAFTANRAGDIQVLYRHIDGDDWTSAAPIDAGTYYVSASMEETDDDAAGSAYAVLTIAKRQLTLSAVASIDGKFYDGTNEVESWQMANGLVKLYNIAVPDKNISGAVMLDPAAVSAVYEDSSAGLRKPVLITVTNAADNLTGSRAGNYTAPDAVFHAISDINKRAIKFKVGSAQKEYGQTLVLDNSLISANGLVGGDTVYDLPVVFTCEGTAADANVGTYTIKAELGSAGNYREEGVTNGTLTVIKATPVNYGINTTTGLAGNKLSSVSLDGIFVNPHDNGMAVSGKLEWKNPDAILTNDAAAAYEWVFAPDDTANYNTASGSVTLNVADKQPVSLTIALPEDLVYNGGPKAVTAAAAAGEDEEVTIVIEYAAHYDAPRSEEAIDVEWTADAPVNAGAYDVRVTAYPAIDSVFAINTVTATMVIEKANPVLVGEITTAEVEQGAFLADIALSGSFAGAFGAELEGTLAWSTVDGSSPTAVVAENGKEYDWVFFPENMNYNELRGTAAVTVYPNTRAPEVVVYNLPGDTGNYAYVTVDGTNLKAGETVTFYSADGSPVSAALTAADDMLGKEIMVQLDNDALSAEAGVIYVQINGSATLKEVPYKAEVGFALDPESIDLTTDESAIVKIVLADEDYEISGDVSWNINNSAAAEIAASDNSSATIEKVMAGNAILTVNAQFVHPDPNMAGHTVEVVRTASVYAATQLPALVPTLGWNDGAFTVDFIFGNIIVNSEAIARVRITAETGEGESVTMNAEVDAASEGVGVATEYTNRYYKAAFTAEVDGLIFEGPTTEKVAVYSLVMRAIAGFEGRIEEEQLEAANKVLKNGGIFIGENGELTPETAIAATKNGDKITLTDKAKEVGLVFTFAGNEVLDRSGAGYDTIIVNEDGTATLSNSVTGLEAVVYLEDVEFMLDIDAVESSADETVSGELDFIEEV